MEKRATVVEVRTAPLPLPAHIYTLYRLLINGVCVREQISAFSQADIDARNTWRRLK